MATALLERPNITEPEVNPSVAGPIPYHWTVDALERATEAGVFEHPERLELVHGRIIDKMAQGEPHTGLRRRLARRLREAIEPAAFVCEECPIRLALDGEPVPDIMFTREADYGSRHPTQEAAVLVVEVAFSSVDYDLGEKALLYSQAGISDYWVVLAEAQAIVRHRQPSEDGYGEVTHLAGADMISPLARPEAGWTISALLGREE